ncbi:MAG: DNA/RNA non-specific endonuclease [Eubacterium sp.]
MKKGILSKIVVVVGIFFAFAGCTNIEYTGNSTEELSTEDSILISTDEFETADLEYDTIDNNTVTKDEIVNLVLALSYSNEPCAVINNNIPFYTQREITTEEFENYTPLDSLGRCGIAFANISPLTLPTEERGSIGQIKPTGWHTVKYNDLIDGNYLYNRCHLIAYELAGENANEMNLITGTRYMNIQGMLPFENQIADYVKQTGNHVLYRVTPVFKDEELVARGVILEGYSVEDKGDGICFCVYAFNVQPGIQITYLDGNSCISTREEIDICENNSTEEDANQEYTYVLNKNTKKFHYESCSSVQDIKEKNKEIVNATRDDIIDMGYKPCGRCKP